MVNEENPKEQSKAAQRKTPKKSPYLFPVYNFAEAKHIAETVENDGGGTLTEETLAVNLRQSAKSSGFKLKTLTARQFQLLTKQGNNLMTTPLAKAIFKPRTDNEQREAMKQSFLAIPLFRAVANRFKGQPLPQGDSFRNILEREFQIDNQRVSSAERVLLDSARDAGVLVNSGNKTYLSTDIQGIRPDDKFIDTDSHREPPYQSTPPRYEYPIDSTPPQSRGMLDISISDLALLSKEDFKTVWDALGKVVQAKGEQELKAKTEPVNEDSKKEQGETKEIEGDIQEE